MKMKKLIIGGLSFIGALSALTIGVHAEEPVVEETPIVEETPVLEEETPAEETPAEEKEDTEVVSVDEVIAKLQDSYNTINTFLIGALGFDAMVALYVIGRVALAYLRKNKDRIARDAESKALLDVIDAKMDEANQQQLKKIEAMNQDKAREAEKQAKAYEDKLLQIVENAKLD